MEWIKSVVSESARNPADDEPSENPSTPGDLVFRLNDEGSKFWADIFGPFWGEHDIEVLGATGGGAWWMIEGGFPEQDIKGCGDGKDYDGLGVYVMTGVTLHYHKDCWGEVDEEMRYECIRKATPEEIAEHETGTETGTQGEGGG